jgi:CheY-like chemotaxis protein
MKPIHILLVEDNEGDILLTTEALNEGKIINSISVVKDGNEAIHFLEKSHKYAQAQTPDLILLDINLPKMNGHEVLKNVKANKQLKQIPVIMFTTSLAEKDISSSYQNYANCYITKPVDVNDYINVVSAIKNFWNSIVQLPKKNN